MMPSGRFGGIFLQNMKLLLNNCTDAAYNLALEEIIASEYTDAMMLWRNANAIIVGRNQNTGAEINPEFVRQRGIQVIRRMTGGGAVYHDLGNINYTLIAPGRQLEQQAFARNAGIVVQILQKMGVAAEFQGRNDILVGGRKISGSAKCVLSDRSLFHGTLLFDTDLSVLGSALTPDENKIRAKGIKSVRSRVANLREYLPEMDVEQFLEKLKQSLQEFTGSAWTEIPDDLQQRASALAAEKYRTWEWNYGTVGKYSYEWKSRFACGGVEVYFNVVENRIADMVILGDFFGSSDVAELAAKFNGLPPEISAIKKTAETCGLAGYITGITPEEFITLFRL